MGKIIVTLWITFGIYLMVLLATMANLWSGVRKDKKKLTGKEKDALLLQTLEDFGYIG